MAIYILNNEVYELTVSFVKSKVDDDLLSHPNTAYFFGWTYQQVHAPRSIMKRYSRVLKKIHKVIDCMWCYSQYRRSHTHRDTQTHTGFLILTSKSLISLTYIQCINKAQHTRINESTWQVKCFMLYVFQYKIILRVPFLHLIIQVFPYRALNH